MNEYDFTLKFKLPDVTADAATYIEDLGETCTDALVGIAKPGRIALNFIREAESGEEAVISAIEDVKQVIPAATLIEAAPDLVGLTDVAEMLGFSRQNMRKLMEKAGSAFPVPAYEGKYALWHLADILGWLITAKEYPLDDSLYELAAINMLLNININREKTQINPELEKRLRAMCA